MAVHTKVAIVLGLIVVGGLLGEVVAVRQVTGTPAELSGTWSGSARIAVDWTAQRTLDVRLAIAPDGGVTGMVGDATLLRGRLHANRSAIGRFLHIKTDWIVTAGLDGDLVKAEAVRREAVSIPFNLIDGHLEGGVTSSGTFAGSSDTMKLAAGHMRLERVR